MKKILTALLVVAATASVCVAANETATEEETVRAVFNKFFPQMEVDAVSKSPVSGIYEMISGEKVFYFVPTSGHIITGAIWSKEGENLTAKTVERLAATRAQESYALLNPALDKAIKVGSGKNVVIEITDPDCPYCRRMHDYWKTRSDVTRYIFLMPIPQLHPNAQAKAKYILASADREKAMDEVFSGKFDAALPEAGDDKGQLAVHEDLTSQTGIKGTPAFFVNGTFVHGANVPAIEKLIGEAAPAMEDKTPDTQPAK